MTRPYFKFTFGIDGDLVTVPQMVQPDGSVSYQEGFGPDYELEYGVNPDALPVPRAQTNQLYNDLTAAVQQLQQNGFNLFISSADNGGTAFSYGLGTIVYFTDGSFYQSSIASNTNIPGDGSGTWQLLPIVQQGLIPVTCDYAATGNLALTGLQNIDGGTGVDGQIIGCFGQTTASDRGVYVMHSGAWTRSPYYNSTANVKGGAIIPIRAGTVNGGKLFQLTTSSPIVVGTTALSYTTAGGVSAVISVNGHTGTVVLTTSDIAEGSNLYFTAPRVITAMTGEPLSLFVNDVGYSLTKMSVNFSSIVVSGTYTRAGTLVTGALAAHGMSTGDAIYFNATSGAGTSGYYPVTVTGTNSFTFTDTASGTTSGNFDRNIWARDPLNISSILRNSAGDYTVTMSAPMPRAFYNLQITASAGAGNNEAICTIVEGSPPTTSAFRFTVKNIDPLSFDSAFVSCQIIK